MPVRRNREIIRRYQGGNRRRKRADRKPAASGVPVGAMRSGDAFEGDRRASGRSTRRFFSTRVMSGRAEACACGGFGGRVASREETAMPLVESKIEGLVGTICLDYFEKRNAFSAALVEDFVKALEVF